MMEINRIFNFYILNLNKKIDLISIKVVQTIIILISIIY